MSLFSRNIRPVILMGVFTFGLGVWPTVYCPLGEDIAGNPMRENRFTGKEEVMPAGSGQWVDAVEFLQNHAKASGSEETQPSLVATLEQGRTSFR